MFALAVVAAALGTVVAPVAAQADPPYILCHPYWPNGYPVYVDGDGYVNVNPNGTPGWVC
jgi:hypothetical protein